MLPWKDKREKRESGRKNISKFYWKFRSESLQVESFPKRTKTVVKEFLLLFSMPGRSSGVLAELKGIFHLWNLIKEVSSSLLWYNCWRLFHVDDDKHVKFPLASLQPLSLLSTSLTPPFINILFHLWIELFRLRLFHNFSKRIKK